MNETQVQEQLLNELRKQGIQLRSRRRGRHGELPVPRPVKDLALARLLTKKVRQMLQSRNDEIRRVRAEIEAGSYETPEKIEIAAERMLEDLHRL